MFSAAFGAENIVLRLIHFDCMQIRFYNCVHKLFQNRTFKFRFGNENMEEQQRKYSEEEAMRQYILHCTEN